MLNVWIIVAVVQIKYLVWFVLRDIFFFHNLLSLINVFKFAQLEIMLMCRTRFASNVYRIVKLALVQIVVIHAHLLIFALEYKTLMINVSKHVLQDTIQQHPTVFLAWIVVRFVKILKHANNVNRLSTFFLQE